MLLFLLLSYAGSCFFSRTNPISITDEPSHLDVPVREVSFPAKDDSLTIKAWWHKPDSANRAIILVNGMRGNRSGLDDHLRYYAKRGWAVLAIDLRGTGESEGDVVTFGCEERKDILGAYHYLQQQGIDTIAAHGISLGAAAIVYSLDNKPDYQFMVLESVYDRIGQTFHNRLDMFSVPHFLGKPMEWISEWRLGIDIEKLSPINYLEQNEIPVLFLAGDSEQRVRRSETENIFARSGSPQKQLYFFEGARHEHFAKMYPKAWQTVLDEWMEHGITN